MIIGNAAACNFDSGAFDVRFSLKSFVGDLAATETVKWLVYCPFSHLTAAQTRTIAGRRSTVDRSKLPTQVVAAP
jgi:hypothetical protein